MRAPGEWTMKFDVALLEAVEEWARIMRGGRGVRRDQRGVTPLQDSYRKAWVVCSLSGEICGYEFSDQGGFETTGFHVDCHAGRAGRGDGVIRKRKRLGGFSKWVAVNDIRNMSGGGSGPFRG